MDDGATFSSIEIRAYLLGTLSSERQELIDVAILSGDDLDDQIAVAEGLLIDEYLNGQLNADERLAFKSAYLTSEARSSKVRQINDLMYLGGANRSNERSSSVRYSESDQVRTFVQWLRPLMAATIVLIVVGTAGYFYLNSRTPRVAIDDGIARLNEQGIKPSDLSDVGTKISVTPGLTRGSSTLASFAATPQNILFSMALPYSADAKGLLSANLYASSEIVATTKVRKPQMLKDDGIVRLLLPGDLFKPAQYHIELLDESGKVIGRYYFNVTQ